MITGWKKLIKEECKHVTRDAGCLTNAQWQQNIDFQNNTEAATGKPACWQCWMIGRKLSGKA